MDDYWNLLNRYTLQLSGVLIIAAVLLFIFDLQILGVLTALGSIATISNWLWGGQDSSSVNEEAFEELVSENQRTLELRDEIENLTGDVEDYTRMIRALEEKNIDLDDLIEEYRTSERIILLTMINQKPKIGSKPVDGETAFIKLELQKELGLEKITNFTYAVPPDEVPQELAHADREELRNWLQEKVYDRHPDRSGDLPMFVVADLRQAVSVNDTKGEQMNVEFIDEIIAQSEIFSNNARLAEILASENISLSDIIKDSNIFFFLPTYLSQAEVDDLKATKTAFLREIGEPNLRELTTETTQKRLEESLEERGIGRPKQVSEDTVKEAEIWNEKTRDIW